MKPLLFLLACLTATCAHAARTPFQARCEDSGSKTTTVLLAQQNGFSIDNSVSYRNLSTMHRGGPNTFVLGLTKTESRVLVEGDSAILQDSASDFECVMPHLSVSLYFLPFVVYVGHEFEPGTCAYDEVLAHEMRHIKAYLGHLPKVEAVVRKALVARFGSTPLYAPKGQAMALLQREIDTRWLPYFRAEMEKVKPLQLAIDTPGEYERLSKVCKGEVQSIIGPAPK